MPIKNLLPAELPELPELSANPEEILNRMIAQYESAYLEQNGSPATLATGDPIRIWIYTISLQQYLLENLVKYFASQNYITYAKGDYLDNISATRGGPERAGESSAVVKMRFIFSTALTQAETIPANTRVTTAGAPFFAVKESHTVPAGATTWEGVFVCQTPGIIGNGYSNISTLVDPLPYVQSVINLDIPQGGADLESDSQYAERIFLSPEGYAVAGPELAYEYLAKSFRPEAVEDVKAYSPGAGRVNIVPLLKNGEVPGTAFLSELLEFVSARDKRPLTDYVQTVAPEITPFEVKFTYYIASDRTASEQAIQAAVTQAVKDFIDWQKSRLGRDIDPQELICRVREAGAKRLVIASPEYTVINPYGIAIAGEPSVTYGGLEDE